MAKQALGVCYYPEHWPEERWAIDAKMMRDTGISWVRIGEFAWARMEPKPGKLDWAWLDRAVDTLGDAGLKVIMGTPTATPPRWMVDKYPDFLFVDAHGVRRKHGSRRHYCPSHPGYRDESARITKLMAERYGAHPAVMAWQTDNEYACHDTTRSYSDAALAGFRIWLEGRYGDIAALNKAWGNVFWSMDYNGFDQVELPNQTMTEANPAHWLDFNRYSSDAVVAFNKIQTDILRDYSQAPLVHNYMGRTVDFDHFKVGDDLDIASWDSYPLGFLEDRSDFGDDWKKRFMRQGDPDFQAFHHDLYRSVGRGRWWIMEQQPGPVNWAPYNPAPLDGMPRLWAWEAFAHGAETVCYFRWRQAPFAQEQMHAGLLRPDGQPAQALGEATKVGQELASMPDIETNEASVAIVFDYESAWAWASQPQSRDFDYFRMVFDFYRACRRQGWNIDILPPDCSDFGDRKLVLIPGLLTWNDSILAAINSFNGQILAGPRSGSKSANLTFPDAGTDIAMPPQLPGIDVLVDRVESLRPDAPVALDGKGNIQLWREFLDGDSGTILSSRDGHAVLKRQGNIHYLGGWPDDAGLDHILDTCLPDIDLPRRSLPTGLRLRQAGNISFAINYDKMPHQVPDGCGDLSGKTLEPAAILAIDDKGNILLS